MLTLARAGDTIGHLGPVKLPELLKVCWRNIVTDSAQLIIETDITIKADKPRLQQLLENLLRNGVQHGGDEVTVTVGDLRSGFYVEDDGSGIPVSERENVFAPGYTTSEEGTGFGLRIVRDIADAHGWTIEVTASPAGGARFEFTGVQCE